ncbi:MAG: 50S ribosomal protein L30 [Halobacteriales archaeon]
MQAVVQLRGEVNISEEVDDTLAMLNLGRVNHCTLLPETDVYRGMITKVHDYVAHGEPSTDTVATLLRHRGEPESGERDIDDEWVEANTDYDSVEALAEALITEETTLSEAGLTPVLRLHPPRGGHDGVKKPVVAGGQIGNHTTEEIDTLLTAMR